MARLFSIRSGGRVPAAVAIATIFMFVVTAWAHAAPLKPGMVSGQSPKLTPALQQIATPAGSSATNAAQAQRMFLPASGPGSPIRAGSDVVVTARVSSTDASVQQALRQAGAEIQTVSSRYETITFAVAPADLDQIAAVSAVHSVEPELAPLFNTVTCPWGSVRSEGDTQLQAGQTRTSFGVNGTGVKVGIISDSFDTWSSAPTRWSTDVASGDLPGATNTCGFTTAVNDVLDGTGNDEGRAMAQVVHDLAPGATLAFASANASTEYPTLVSNLRSAGSNVIADDITWFNEPFFQDGPNAVAANAAAAAGVPMFSSAANNNVIVGGRNVGSWEAPAFRSATCPTAMAIWNGCMDFDPGPGVSNTESITIGPNGHFYLDMQWAEPWYGVTTDLDACLLDNAGNLLGCSSTVNPGPTGTQKPFEAFSFTNGGATATYKLAFGRWSGTGTPRVKFVLLSSSNIQSVQFPTSSGGDIVGPTIFGHNGAASVMSMAAVPYSDSTQVEPFSSRGPVTHYYGPVTGTTPAAPLASPEVLAKPDAAATDGAQTTFFYGLSGGVYRFWGTSEASPHAAAIAALQLSAKPTATVSEIYTAQQRTAQAVGSFGADAAGSGLLNATGAVGVLVTTDPTAATGGASGVGWSTATVTGTVNPEGSVTGYRFQYGTTQAYGSGTAVEQAGVGTADVPVTAQLSGLTPSTTYHYRMIAIRFGAILAAGADRTFITQPAPIPTVTTGAASAPLNTALPTITGTATPGATLSCSAGSWTGASSYAYLWLRDAVPVPGAGAQTYRPASGDLGHQVACRVTARNASGSTSATSAPVRVVDLAPPRLTSLKLSPNRFRAARSGASIVLTGTKGTLVRSVLDEAATVNFGVERSQVGRTVKGRCQRPTRANARAKHCTMWTSVKGTFRWNGKPGTNTFRFTGRLNGKALPRGSYRLVATARDVSGNLAAPVRVTFTIK